jgi:hypothetical protein
VADAKRRAPAIEYVAECFWPGVTKTDLVRLDARVLAAVEPTNDPPSRVRYLGARLLPTDEVVFCFFEGPSGSGSGDRCSPGEDPLRSDPAVPQRRWRQTRLASVELHHLAPERHPGLGP